MNAHARKFLDQHVVDAHAAVLLTLDARGGPWVPPPVRTLTRRVGGVAVLRLRAEDLEGARDFLSKTVGLGFQVFQPRGAILYACRDPADAVCDPTLPLVRVGDVAVAAFTEPPAWAQLTDRVRGCRALLGTLGFDRAASYALCVVASRALGLAHALCGGADPGDCSSVVYVRPDTFFADCSWAGRWRVARVVHEGTVTEDDLPFAVDVGGRRFPDTLAVSYDLARDLCDLARDAEVIAILRHIRKRNQDSDGQPRWGTVSARASATVWDRLWRARATVKQRDVVVVTLRGLFVLHMAKA